VIQLAIKGAPHSSSKNTETTPHYGCCVFLHSLCESLRTQNSWEQASETSSSCDNCTSRLTIKFLGSATLRDCSLVRTTTSWWCELSFDYFLVVCASVPLLPEGCSWDITAFILPASNYIDYFKLLSMSTVGNGTTGASGTGPASEYNLELSYLLIMFFLFSYKLNVNTSNPYDAIILLIFTHSMICFMIFGIKICHKMPKSLT
jgi:hypothetical protein